jgi:hypothetical protein
MDRDGRRTIRSRSVPAFLKTCSAKKPSMTKSSKPLGLIYYRERKYLQSLKTLDQAFSTAAELHARRESLLPMATSARNIAIETLHWMEAIKWESRVRSLPEPPSKVAVKHLNRQTNKDAPYLQIG